MSQKAETNRRSFDYWRQADVILPTQDHARTRVLDDPEHRLRFAVPEDAVHQFQRYVNAVGRRERALYEDVLDWFASENRSEPFSFESVCDALHIDPDFVREPLASLAGWRSDARVTITAARGDGAPHDVVARSGLQGSRASGVRTPALLVDSSA